MRVSRLGYIVLALIVFAICWKPLSAAIDNVSGSGGSQLSQWIFIAVVAAVVLGLLKGPPQTPQPPSSSPRH